MSKLPEQLSPLVAALTDLARWLHACNVRGAVIGGIAASIHGSPRATRDVDAVVSIEFSQLDHFVAEAAQFGIRPRIEDAITFAKQSRVLLLAHDASSIELDIALAGLAFEEETYSSGRAVRVDLALAGRRYGGGRVYHESAGRATQGRRGHGSHCARVEKPGRRANRAVDRVLCAGHGGARDQSTRPCLYRGRQLKFLA